MSHLYKLDFHFFYGNFAIELIDGKFYKMYNNLWLSLIEFINNKTEITESKYSTIYKQHKAYDRCFVCVYYVNNEQDTCVSEYALVFMLNHKILSKTTKHQRFIHVLAFVSRSFASFLRA